MLQIWHATRGFVDGGVACTACPCHLPITLPFFIALTARTTFSTWLENNAVTVILLSIVVFISGLVLAFGWIRQSRMFNPIHSA